jgi:oligoendopeptidase F
MYVPLTKYVLNIPYDVGVKWVLESLKPLGEEYVKIATEGITKQGWGIVEKNNNKGIYIHIIVIVVIVVVIVLFDICFDY